MKNRIIYYAIAAVTVLFCLCWWIDSRFEQQASAIRDLETKVKELDAEMPDEGGGMVAAPKYHKPVSALRP